MFTREDISRVLIGTRKQIANRGRAALQHAGWNFPQHGQGLVIDLDLSDAEQRVVQLSRGQFSLSFLLFAQKYGWRNAQLI